MIVSGIPGGPMESETLETYGGAVASRCGQSCKDLAFGSASAALRKRCVITAALPLVGHGSGDEAVASLLPKMKRMRLRPSLGQLRLQREADDVSVLLPQVRLSVEPEHLRATLMIASSSGSPVEGSDSVQLELSFPPQYPHRPPRVVQVMPEELLPVWRYDGRFVILTRLTDKCWSSAMGVMDIIRDLIEPFSSLGALGGSGEAAGMTSLFPPVPLAVPCDIEMG